MYKELLFLKSIAGPLLIKVTIWIEQLDVLVLLNMKPRVRIGGLVPDNLGVFQSATSKVSADTQSTGTGHVDGDEL